MAWIIKSSHDGPVIINDLGIMLNRGQMKDLDLLGRDAAERSNDVKVLIAKKLIIELKKDAVTPNAPAASNSAAMESLAASVKQASEAMAQTQAQNETIAKQNEKINELSTQLTEQKILTQEVISNTAKIVEAVNKFATDFPVEVRTIKKAMENIKVERGNISDARQELANEDVTETVIKAQERILANKDKKLEKNLLDLGKSVTKNAVEKAEDVDSALDAMDELGI